MYTNVITLNNNINHVNTKNTNKKYTFISALQIILKMYFYLNYLFILKNIL